MKPDRLAIIFCSSILLTILLLQWWQEASYPLLLWELLCGISVVGLLGFLRSGTRKASAVILCLTIGIALGLLRVGQTTHVATPVSIENFADDTTVTAVEGVIVNTERGPTSRRYVLEVQSITMHEEKREATGRLLVRDMSQWPLHTIGDTIRAFGTVDQPRRTADFSEDKYLHKMDIFSTMLTRKTELVRSQSGTSIVKILSSLRGHLEHQSDLIFPEPENSLLKGLLTGGGGTSLRLVESLRATGLSHITAISGSNITIILAIIGGLLFFLPLKLRVLPQMIFICLFAVMVGGSASVVRATIMGILGLLALETNRRKDTLLAILWTATLMTLWNPSTLWYDLGFHLSFLAVIGLHIFTPILKPRLIAVPSSFGIREALLATIAAQLLALPWSVLYSGELPLLSPLANVLVAPLVPLAMLLGSIAILFSFLWMPLGLGAGFLAWGVLHLIVLIARTLAALPFAVITVGPLPHIIVGLYYGVLLLIAKRFWPTKDLRI